MSDRHTALAAIAGLLLFFAAGTFVVVELMLGRDLPLVPSPDRVAVVPLEGPIVSAEPTLEAIRRFRENQSVRAFVLEIQSPGGTVGASQSLYREIRSLRDEDDRPVVAWIGDVGASGGYYVALAADSLLALPGSITGSIGVVMEFPNLQGLMEKVGVGMEVVKSGPRKDAGSPFRPLDESDREVFRQLVDDVYGQFVDAVAESRALERERVEEIADGRVFSGERAVELGLVDGLATRSEAVDLAGRMAGLGASPRTVRPDRRRITLLDILGEGVSLATVREWIGGLLGRVPVDAGAPRLLYRWQ